MKLLHYPIDIRWLLSTAPLSDRAPFANEPALPEPTRKALLALAHWNASLDSDSNQQKVEFLACARDFLDEQVPLAGRAGGWPITTPRPEYYAPRPWLSASAQGTILSVLLRAYQLLGDESFLLAARRALHTFERDILDSGIHTPVDADGLFFEDVAVYPAAHILSGHLFALLSLFEYVRIVSGPENTRVQALLQRGLAALNDLIDAFDTRYCTRFDLLYRRPASPFYAALHVALLDALASYPGCAHFAAIVRRWTAYRQRPACRLRYSITRRIFTVLTRRQEQGQYPGNSVRADDAGQSEVSVRVCVPITGFPIAGGMRSVLAGVSQVMRDQWDMVYLTRRKGESAGEFEIEVFGNKLSYPWQFPGVWLYFLTGAGKLLKLLWRRPSFALILPQDGVFTGAFAALVGKLVGVRVVCMDHGNVTRLNTPAFRAEVRRYLKSRPWPERVLFRLLYALYLPSMHMLAWLSTRFADQFLIAGDEVEAVYREQLGVNAYRIIRYAYMVDVERFTPPDPQTRADRRVAHAIAEDAILVSMINRLASEKGLSFALEGISFALAQLPADSRSLVRVIIAGSGPLRAQVEADIRQYGLEDVCILWGEAPPQDVVTILGMSDIFLYSGTRGTNYSMAVLEAMAAGCAVVASTSPQSNAQLLVDERGIAIAPASSAEIGAALARLCSNPALTHYMGQRAREYVSTHHTARSLRRNLLRASYFAPSLIIEYAQKDKHACREPLGKDIK